MRIYGIGGSDPRRDTRRTTPDRRMPQEQETRALIAVDAAAAGERQVVVSHYPAAPFLAHLIATRMQAAQTRARRRAEPEAAVLLYAGSVAGRPGPKFRYDA